MARTYRRKRRSARFGRKGSRKQRVRTRRSRRPHRHKRRSRARRDGASVDINGWKNNVSNKGSCLVVYHMNGCGACMHFKSTWNKYVTDHENQCAIAVERSEDVSKHKMGLERHMKNVAAFPTIMMVDRNGKIIGNKVGAIDENTLDEFVKSSMRN